MHSAGKIDSTDLFARKMKLGNLVDYRSGSVVSRTLVDRETGPVTLFSFDTRQGLSEHTAPYDALILVLDGDAEITISGKIQRLSKDEAIVMPANRPHAVRAVTRVKMMLIMIHS